MADKKQLNKKQLVNEKLRVFKQTLKDLISILTNDNGEIKKSLFLKKSQKIRSSTVVKQSVTKKIIELFSLMEISINDNDIDIKSITSTFISINKQNLSEGDIKNLLIVLKLIIDRDQNMTNTSIKAGRQVFFTKKSTKTTAIDYKNAVSAINKESKKRFDQRVSVLKKKTEALGKLKKAKLKKKAAEFRFTQITSEQAEKRAVLEGSTKTKRFVEGLQGVVDKFDKKELGRTDAREHNQQIIDKQQVIAASLVEAEREVEEKKEELNNELIQLTRVAASQQALQGNAEPQVKIKIKKKTKKLKIIEGAREKKEDNITMVKKNVDKRNKPAEQERVKNIELNENPSNPDEANFKKQEVNDKEQKEQVKDMVENENNVIDAVEKFLIEDHADKKVQEQQTKQIEQNVEADPISDIFELAAENAEAKEREIKEEVEVSQSWREFATTDISVYTARLELLRSIVNAFAGDGGFKKKKTTPEQKMKMMHLIRENINSPVYNNGNLFANVDDENFVKLTNNNSEIRELQLQINRVYARHQRQMRTNAWEQFIILRNAFENERREDTLKENEKELSQLMQRIKAIKGRLDDDRLIIKDFDEEVKIPLTPQESDLHTAIGNVADEINEESVQRKEQLKKELIAKIKLIISKISGATYNELKAFFAIVKGAKLEDIATLGIDFYAGGLFGLLQEPLKKLVKKLIMILLTQTPDAISLISSLFSENVRVFTVPPSSVSDEVARELEETAVRQRRRRAERDETKINLEQKRSKRQEIDKRLQQGILNSLKLKEKNVKTGDEDAPDNADILDSFKSSINDELKNHPDEIIPTDELEEKVGNVVLNAFQSVGERTGLAVVGLTTLISSVRDKILNAVNSDTNLALNIGSQPDMLERIINNLQGQIRNMPNIGGSLSNINPAIFGGIFANVFAGVVAISLARFLFGGGEPPAQDLGGEPDPPAQDSRGDTFEFNKGVESKIPDEDRDTPQNIPGRSDLRPFFDMVGIDFFNKEFAMQPRDVEDSEWAHFGYVPPIDPQNLIEVDNAMHMQNIQFGGSLFMPRYVPKPAPANFPTMRSDYGMANIYQINQAFAPKFNASISPHDNLSNVKPNNVFDLEWSQNILYHPDNSIL